MATNPTGLVYVLLGAYVYEDTFSITSIPGKFFKPINPTGNSFSRTNATLKPDFTIFLDSLCVLNRVDLLLRNIHLNCIFVFCTRSSELGVLRLPRKEHPVKNTGPAPGRCGANAPCWMKVGGAAVLAPGS